MDSQIKKVITLFVGLTLSAMSIAKEVEPDESVMIGGRVYSITTWKKAAKEGIPFPQYMLGTLYLTGEGVPKDVDLGIEYLKKAAKQKELAAQEALAGLYMFGSSDITKDPVEARKWYEMAAKQGSAKAYYSLGLIYNGGLGVEKNKSKAKSWFGQACNNGVDAGCDEYKKISQ